MGRLQRKKSPSVKKRAAQKTDDGKKVDSDTQVSTGATVKQMPAAKKSAPPTRTAGKVREPNFIDKSLQFLREVKVELKKVAWPSRKQTIGSTVVVMVLVSLIAAFLGLVDIILGNLIQVVLR